MIALGRQRDAEFDQPPVADSTLFAYWDAGVDAFFTLPPDDLLLRLGALSPTLGFAAENPEWAREWLADPFTQDALLVQQCVVRVLLALRTMAEARAADLTTKLG